MFSVVLLAALTAGENAADFHFRSCYGGAHSCYGTCYGSCYGGWGHSKHYYGGCFGGCAGACYGSCFGCSGCCGVVMYSAACYGCGGCYGGCYGGWGGCSGGCWGAPFAGYGPAYNGCGHMNPAYGCGGYISPAYGVPGPVIGTPVPATPAPAPATPAPMDEEKKTSAIETNRAQVVFTLPENAKLYVEGQLIENASEIKTFRTPVLETGKTFVYSMRIVVEKDGEKLVGETTVNVQAGRTENVDLTTVELKRDVAVAAR